MIDDVNAREQLSVMTEITESTIRKNLHRNADLNALYRACPTAFWLAPGGDDALPPTDGPLMKPAPVQEAPATASIDLPAAHGLSKAVLYGMVSAGPIFTATALTLDRTVPDDHWWQAVERGAMSLIAFPLTITFGAVLALLPVLLGVQVLAMMGERLSGVRMPAVWAATGGAMGAVIATLFDVGGPTGLALIATSVLTARIARTAIYWSEPELA